MLAQAGTVPAASSSGRGSEKEERAAPVNGPVEHVLSQELLLYLDRVKGLLQGQQSTLPAQSTL